jgi:hypothetical protein
MRVLTDWTYISGQGPEDQWYYARLVISSLYEMDECRWVQDGSSREEFIRERN